MRVIGIAILLTLAAMYAAKAGQICTSTYNPVTRTTTTYCY